MTATVMRDERKNWSMPATLREYCVLVKVVAHSGDDAWNIVSGAMGSYPSAVVAGSPRCANAKFVDDYSDDNPHNLVTRDCDELDGRE